MEFQIEKTVLSYCREHDLLTSGTILVALSGGGDSVALLHILRKFSTEMAFEITAAHLNHGLRGKASGQDEDFCRELCGQLEIPLIVERVREGIISKSPGSLETAARNARLAFLEQSAASVGADRIATGHTVDDQAETMLQRILRGTGPSGLAGILPKRDNLWIRPLLAVTRAELREYLAERKIDYREDESNTDTAFFRNRIRHDLLPFLQKDFSPNIPNILSRLADLSQEQESFLDDTVQSAYASCLLHEAPDKILLDKQRFMAYHTFLQQRIARLALQHIEGKGRDTDKEEIQTVLDVFARTREKADITSKTRCESIGSYLAFALHECSFDPVDIALPGKTDIPCSHASLVSEQTSGTVRVDGRQQIVVTDGIGEKYGRLTVGTIHPGDTITPYGSSKTVKIRDLFSEESIPVIFRDTVPVVRAGAVPVWIPGLRSSDILRQSVTSTSGSRRYLLRYEHGAVWRNNQE